MLWGWRLRSQDTCQTFGDCKENFSISASPLGFNRPKLQFPAIIYTQLKINHSFDVSIIKIEAPILMKWCETNIRRSIKRISLSQILPKKMQMSKKPFRFLGGFFVLDSKENSFVLSWKNLPFVIEKCRRIVQIASRGEKKWNSGEFEAEYAKVRNNLGTESRLATSMLGFERGATGGKV